MRRASAVLVVVVIALAAVAGTAWSEPTNQTFILTTTDPAANTGRVVAYGAITAVGTYVFGGQGPDPFPARFTFDDGDVLLTISPDPPVNDFDPRSCVLRQRTSGAVAITGGTGEFLVAAGRGRFTGRAVVVFGRSTQGACRLEDGPVFVAGLVQAIASLTAPTAG